MRTATSRPTLDTVSNLRDESGATATEYALLAAFIAVAIGTTIGLLGQTLLVPFITIRGWF